MLSEPPFSILDNFNAVDDAIDTNAELADKILDVGLESFGLSATPSKEDPTQNWHGTATSSDVNKAHSTIRQFYRDWSAEGRVEREVCYDPVLQDLRTEFQARRDTGEEIKVLVPGAGLGRLVFDVCLAGFAAEGNEISYHQLLASSWVLNHTEGPQGHTIHPFALHFSNLKSRTQQLRSIKIPDVHPGTAIGEAMQANRPVGSMSMSAADFVVLYNQPSNRQAFNAVATVFFIDTAPNLIRYIEAIHHCLQEDGLWINVGPLLWHFEDGHPRRDSDGDTSGIGEPGNVELTEEEVLALVERMGFKIEARPDDRRPCGYIQDGESMLQNIYQPSHWVARKRKVAGA
jgi:carnosine N-methyltransferase